MRPTLKREIKRKMLFGLGLLLLAGAVYALTGRLHFPSGRMRLDTTLSQLPFYAFYSLLRMTVAYLISFFFSVLYGYIAATSSKAEGPLIAFLDVLQSVPILGFFPVAVFFFVNLFQGSRWGVEAASVFLIFTSMAWNMAFSVYESLKTLPGDSIDAADAFGLQGWLKFKRTLFPACIPKLIYSSMISWAGGWYFLIACEIIAIGPIQHHLPGLGSFLIESTEGGEIGRTFSGLLVLVLIIVFLDLFIWRPLSVWGERFRYEFISAAVPPSTSFALRWYRRLLTLKFSKKVKKVLLRLSSKFDFQRPRPQRERSAWRDRIRPQLGRIVGVGFLILIFYGAAKSLALLSQGLAGPLPSDAREIPIALLASFGRLTVAYLLALAWTVPVAFWVGESPWALRIVTPLAEIGASIPATALFPFFILFAVNALGGMNGAAILLILTGMQWYLLFNLIGGVQSIPGDLKEAAQAFGASKRLYWKRLYLPAVLPSLITGSVTAWGGGWNALIVSEYIVYRHQTYSVTGIGAILDRATYEAGNEQMILLSLLSMIIAITLLNRVFWRRLYLHAVEYYKIEY